MAVAKLGQKASLKGPLGLGYRTSAVTTGTKLRTFLLCC